MTLGCLTTSNLMKKYTNPQWRKKCVELAKTIAKTRDRFRCRRCKATKRGGYQIHGSHILPEGGYNNLSTEPINIIALCASCHKMAGNSWHESPLDQAWFHRMYPGVYKKLKRMHEELANTKINYEEKHKILKIQLNELENEIHEN